MCACGCVRDFFFLFKVCAKLWGAPATPVTHTEAVAVSDQLTERATDRASDSAKATLQCTTSRLENPLL